MRKEHLSFDISYQLEALQWAKESFHDLVTAVWQFHKDLALEVLVLGKTLHIWVEGPEKEVSEFVRDLYSFPTLSL